MRLGRRRESDEFEDDWSNEINAQTVAVVKAPLRESAVSAPIETDLTVATVCAPMQVDIKVANAGYLEFTEENSDQVMEEIRPCLISNGVNAKVEHINTDTR